MATFSISETEAGWPSIRKGLIGERGYDYANIFLQPVADRVGTGATAGRLAMVAEATGQDRARLLQWIIAYGGLSAAWTLESAMPADGPWRALAIAEMAVAET